MAGMKWVFIMGLAGGLAGIFYLIVKQLLGRRFSMRSRCLFLSGIVVLFLIPAGMLLPAFPTVFGVSLASLGQQQGSGAETAKNPETIEQTGDGIYHMDGTDVKPTAQPDSTSNPEENVKENMLAQILSWKVFAGLWAAVFFLSFFVKMLRYGQYCHECIKNSGPAEENIQNLAKEEKERLGIRQTVSIRCWKQNKAAKYPTFALGLIKPMILLPNSASVDDALRLTLDHELTHVKYYHLWLKAAVELTVSAHWYHPMAYWLRSECGRTCEYAVDEALAGEFSEERRRDYCQLLLNEAARQAAGCRFASDMVPEKKRLKERMMSIMRYQQVSKKVKAATCGLLAAGLAVCLFAEGCVGGQTQKQEAQQAVGAVYVGEDGLYYLDLKDRQVTNLDTGAEIKSPKISPKGSYVAYIKEDMLYLTKTNGGEPRKIADGEQSYCWYDDASLLFCIQDAQNGEITRIWAGSEKTEKYGDPQYRYSNLTAGGNQMIYVQKSRMEEDGTKNIPLGVISLSMEDGKEEVLIEAVSYADERYQLGSSYQPQIEGISADGGYLYLWDRTQSGSTTADGVRLGVYDLKERVYMRMVEGNLVKGPITPEEPWDMYILLNKSNLSASPTDPLLLAANVGSGREMYQNKQLALVDFQAGTETMLTDPSQVTETVSFSLDGKSVYYAAGPEFTVEEQMLDSESISELWYSREHSIYRMDLDSGKAFQLTKGHFDMLPYEIRPGTFLFAREEGGQVSLWESDGTSETKAADAINLDSEYAAARFYYAVRPDNIMDILYQ